MPTPASVALPQIVAHRGNAADYPENTLPALRSALELGLTHIEFDVHLTADHVPVVLHDANLLRTTGLDRSALTMAWRELALVKANETTRLGDRFHDVGIPSLAQVVELLGTFPAATAFVELKRASLKAFSTERVVTRVCEILRPVAAQCVVISFDRVAVSLARRLAKLPIGWVLTDLSAATLAECEALAPDYLFCDSQLLAAADAPLWPGPWSWAVYEVKTAELALELAARGVHFVETMAVGSLLRELRGLQT